MIQWEDKWHSEDVPEVGSYIEFEGYINGDLCSPPATHRGFVTSNTYPVFVVIPPVANFMSVTRWRRSIVGDTE
jgi:hypothetical protein